MICLSDVPLNCSASPGFLTWWQKKCDVPASFSLLGSRLYLVCIKHVLGNHGRNQHGDEMMIINAGVSQD